jgi:hypothetical protein
MMELGGKALSSSLLAAGAGTVQARHDNARQKRDDGNDDKEFYEGESSLAGSSHTLIL